MNKGAEKDPPPKTTPNSSEQASTVEAPSSRRTIQNNSVFLPKNPDAMPFNSPKPQRQNFFRTIEQREEEPNIRPTEPKGTIEQSQRQNFFRPIRQDETNEVRLHMRPSRINTENIGVHGNSNGGPIKPEPLPQQISEGMQPDLSIIHTTSRRTPENHKPASLPQMPNLDTDRNSTVRWADEKHGPLFPDV
mmetsp:Transcript_16018/g.24242  ORF Transcript_16018/g.24242 Transcript_16018/m.24242 type:complete len:191 (+) Transcript_16018:63-635(+)